MEKHWVLRVNALIGKSEAPDRAFRGKLDLSRGDRYRTVLGEQQPQHMGATPELGNLCLKRGKDLLAAFFDTDRFDLSPGTRGVLAKNANWMLKYSTVLILVEGHCDERNTREYNLALGDRRANAVRDYLLSLGVAADRVRTISYGEERPFALGRTEEAWRLNRRSHFVITAR